MSLVFNKNSRMPLIWGGLVMLICLFAAYIIGKINVAEAKQILAHSRSNFNTLCNTVVLASATILALLFTVLSLSSGIKVRLKKAFYQRIKQVALFDTGLFILTMIIFLALNFPIEKSESVTSSWYKTIYYTTTISSSVIGGLIVTVMILLYNTISDLIQILVYGGSKNPMADIEDEEMDD